jgi:hypothetical protein
MQPKLDPNVIAQAHAALAKHGTLSAAARSLGIARSTLEGRLKHPAPKPSASLPVTKPKAGKSLADFRAAHDKDYIVPAKIKSALKELGNGWEYEQDFLRMAKVSTTDLALYRDQFADHWVVVDRSGKRVWAGSRTLIDEMRGMIRG